MEGALSCPERAISPIIKHIHSAEQNRLISDFASLSLFESCADHITTVTKVNGSLRRWPQVSDRVPIPVFPGLKSINFSLYPGSKCLYDACIPKRMGRFSACSTAFAELDPYDEIHEPTRMLIKDQGKGPRLLICLEFKKRK
jgi:hypothetical protein